jgi:hypothetical protein
MNDPRDDRRLAHHLALADQLAHWNLVQVTHKAFEALANETLATLNQQEPK